MGPGRLRWSGNPSDLVEKIDDPSSLPFLDVDHVFEKVREGSGLYLQRGARTERFLAYDAELKLGSVIRLQGGPDKYTIVNTSGETLHDVMIARLTPEGRRIAWLDDQWLALDRRVDVLLAERASMVATAEAARAR